MPLEVIKKQNISDMVFEQLSAAISAGEWKPGDRLPSESELSASLGVSRVSIRSALQRLSSLGLVVSRRGEGTFVCELNSSQCLNSMIPMVALTAKDRKSMEEFRAIVEVESAALAAERASEEMLERLQKTNEEMKTASDGAEAAAKDMAFHCMIAEATGNPMLMKVFEILREFYMSVFLTNISVMGTSGSGHHDQLIEAFRRRDPEEARKVMSTHLRYSAERNREVHG